MESRAAAEKTRNRAHSLCQRVRRLDVSVAKAENPAESKRKTTLREEALDALKQSLADLESLRMTSRSEDYSISKLKTDIRKTLARTR